MKYIRTEVEGCRIVALEPRGDDRGFFARVWCAGEQRGEGLEASVAQINLSHCGAAGTIRGLHWQVDPHGEAKFSRCIAGRVFDVCVDVRPGSPSFGRWAGVELTSVNRLALHVPAGCAHGYQALDDGSELLYLASTPYVPAAERGIRWDDPAFAIEWPIRSNVNVSDKDRSWPLFSSGAPQR